MPRKTKVLYVLHNHPSMYPGGPETYAIELYEAMRGSSDFEPLLVARIGSEGEEQRRHRPGTPFTSFDGDPNQYLVLTEKGGFDFFLMTYREKALFTRHFADFIRAHDPDVVHFQHPMFIGCELISLVRYIAPRTPIVYTLHDYGPICNRDGKLVRTRSEALCLQASPRRCHECFPEIPEEEFFLRERFLKTHFANVDVFLAPSRFLLDRYVDWGIPPEKIRYEPYGRPTATGLPETEPDRPHTQLGFFGELSPYKNLLLALDAMKLLESEQPEVKLWAYGANLWKYPAEYQEQLLGRIEASGNVGFAGLDWTDELGDSFGGLKSEHERRSLQPLMAGIDWVVVPSRWWEASPLVIREAFRYRRPVICPGIGAMAEQVTDRVNGLHFAFNEARSLADTIRVAVNTPGLWDELRRGIPPVYEMSEHIASLAAIYGECLERPGRAQAPALAG